MEENKTPLELLGDKFTKGNVYLALKELKANFSDELLDAMIELAKPMKGGGASANPMQVIDGVNYHYCRFKQDYVAEELMNMSGGKTKGTSVLASKVAYRIGKAADAIKDEAMAAFVAGNYELGAQKNADSDALRATIEDKETFTDEAMAESIYHPDYGKETNESETNSNDAEETADVI